jgi:hypothetical protein
MTGKACLTVSSSAVPGREDDLRTWYHDVHLVDARLIPGVVSATLYEPRPVEGWPPPAHAFVAVYEVEEDPVAVRAEFDRRIDGGVMKMTPALDPSSLAFGVWARSDTDRG